PKAVATIERRLPMLLTYYQFPASHWKSIRSTNVIESTFATIRCRSNQTNGHASRDAALFSQPQVSSSTTFGSILVCGAFWKRSLHFSLIHQRIVI
ncbi:MAG: transposase, partial [Bradyrhizobiaceae bacterium]|nr:transposase [Bradyrhizobiaceae bacterium]